MLVDQAQITVQAGKGGEGKVSFGRSKKPSGGDGGDGGNVILRGSVHEYDLREFRHQRYFKAEPGLYGGTEQKTGKSGADLIILVPLITYVYDENNQLLAEIKTDGQEFKAANGGRGGLGNYNFRSGQAATLTKTTLGKIGENREMKLLLTLQADLVFIGLPNAGKSSLLNNLTNAQVKVADYQFTTLEPHLGTLDKLVLMDFPGLIENTAAGKGLGTKFFQHAGSAKTIIHVLSLTEADLKTQYKIVRAELEKISPELAAKPEILVLTKTDLLTEAEIKKKVKSLGKVKGKIVYSSIYNLDLLQTLAKTLTEDINID